jgi:hypothetical protein
MATSPKAYEALSVVRLRIPMTDDQGRAVAAGSKGAIVHVHPASPPQEPAYIVEIILFNAQGIHDDSHLVEARHSQVEKL